MRYQFTVTNDDGDILFRATKPSIEMLEEEIGRFERHIAERYNPVEPGVWVKN